MLNLPHRATVLYRRAHPVLALIAYLAASLVLGALLSFPVYVALRGAADIAFDSVLHRVAALTLLLFLPLYLGRGENARREALGVARSPAALARGFFSGFALGILAVSPVVSAFLLLDIRSPTLPAIGTLSGVGLFVAYALLTAVIVGVIEEAYFRGALLAPLRPLPPSLAVSIVSLVYAIVHVLGAPVAAEDVTWSSGLASIARSELSLDAFLALTAAGLLLGAVRYRVGHIALGAGLHAGWVWIMKLSQEYSDVERSSDLLFLEGSFAGTMGYLGLAWIGLLGVGWYAWERLTGSKAT